MSQDQPDPSSSAPESADAPRPGAPAPFRTVSLALTGSGGSGVMTAGQMLLQAAARAGLHGIMGRSMGPQIRGGEAAAFLRISESEVLCPSDRFDVMVAFDWLSTERFAAELALRPISIVLCDRADGKPPAMVTGSGARRVDMPFKEILADIPGGRPNMVGLGACATLIGVPIEDVIAVVRKSLKRKGDAAIEASVAGVLAGVEAVADLDDRFHLRPPVEKRPCWNISGNEAIGLGALRGGVRFVAAYPITPATEVLEWLAPNLEHLGGELVQAEDELASINMAIGGSFGGVPTLTATSGPGLALMIEALGLSVASETPGGGHRRAARRSVDRHPDQVRAERPQHRRLRFARRCAAHRDRHDLGGRLRLHGAMDDLSGRKAASTGDRADRPAPRPDAGRRRPDSTTPASVPSGNWPNRCRASSAAMRDDRDRASRRPRCRACRAANTWPTGWSTPRSDVRRARPRTTRCSSTSACASWKPSTTAPIGPTSTAKATSP